MQAVIVNCHGHYSCNCINKGSDCIAWKAERREGKDAEEEEEENRMILAVRMRCIAMQNRTCI
jgi:hypothetical protein